MLRATTLLGLGRANQHLPVVVRRIVPAVGAVQNPGVAGHRDSPRSCWCTARTVWPSRRSPCPPPRPTSFPPAPRPRTARRRAAARIPCTRGWPCPSGRGPAPGTRSAARTPTPADTCEHARGRPPDELAVWTIGSRRGRHAHSQSASVGVAASRVDRPFTSGRVRFENYKKYET